MIPWLAVCAFVATVATTGIVRSYALTHRILDIPNERSSHVTPTPRGGGLAFVAVVTLVGASGVVLEGGGIPLIWMAWLAGGVVVAAVGAVDDRIGLPASTRLLFQAAAVVPVIVQTGLPATTPSGETLDLGWIGIVVAWLAVVWSVNSFNFMDGTDGIAAAQAVFVFGAVAALAASTTGAGVALNILVICAAAAAGFLVWNLPRAKIFMGDAGSGFLGYCIGALALICASADGPSLWVWMILHTLFIADATSTLAVRALRRERLHIAHRSHVYQRLARRWNSHAKVLVVYSAINLFVLLPIATLGMQRPAIAPLLAAAVLAVASAYAVLLGAGRPDSTSSDLPGPRGKSTS